MAAQQQQAAAVAQAKALSGVAEKLAAVQAEKVRADARNKELIEEARAKERELQLAKDEMLAMNMELNLVLQRDERTRKENQELVDRWMEYKKKEAEEMNRASRWE